MKLINVHAMLLIVSLSQMVLACTTVKKPVENKSHQVIEQEVMLASNTLQR